jgi:Tol biopolymer transport system component
VTVLDFGLAKACRPDSSNVDPSNSPTFDVSSTGTLIYRGGSASELPLIWVSRDGKPQETVLDAGPYRSPSISPDGKQLAYAKTEGSNTDIWVMDLAPGTSTRLTFDPEEDSIPIWSRDGKRLAFHSDRFGHRDLFIKDARRLAE